MAKKTLTALLILFIGATNIVKADWPIGKKRVNFSPAFGYTSTPRYFDSTGKVRASANGGVYSTKTIGLYAATGLSRRVDIFVNVPFSYVTASDFYTKIGKSGIGDITAGISYHTPSDDLKSYFTLKAQFFIPVYSNLSTPYLGYGSKGAQIGVNYSFLPKKGQFTVIEGTIARYFDNVDGPTQLGFGISHGFQLPKFQSLTFVFNHLTSISSNKIFSSNLNSNKDFMVGRIAGSYGKRISRTITPYIQASYPFYGRNVGQGFSFSLFLSIRLP